MWQYMSHTRRVIEISAASSENADALQYYFGVCMCVCGCSCWPVFKEKQRSMNGRVFFKVSLSQSRQLCCNLKPKKVSTIRFSKSNDDSNWSLYKNKSQFDIHLFIFFKLCVMNPLETATKDCTLFYKTQKMGLSSKRAAELKVTSAKERSLRLIECLGNPCYY